MNSIKPLQVDFMFQQKGQTIEVFSLNWSTKCYEFSHDIWLN